MNKTTAQTNAATQPKAEIVFGKGITLEGVDSLVSSDDKKIVASVKGSTLTLEGEGMTVDSLDTEAGSAKITGVFKSLSLRLRGSRARLRHARRGVGIFTQSFFRGQARGFRRRHDGRPYTRRSFLRRTGIPERRSSARRISFFHRHTRRNFVYAS